MMKFKEYKHEILDLDKNHDLTETEGEIISTIIDKELWEMTMSPKQEAYLEHIFEKYEV